MPVERIEQERLRPREHTLDVADHEQRADLSPLAALARDLDRELNHLFERAPALVGAARLGAHRPEDALDLISL